MLPLNHNKPAATIHLRKKGTRYKIKGDVTAAYYQKPQSDMWLTAVCPTLLCVSAEILHKAMVTILSRFLCLTIEFPALSRRQKKSDATETIVWEERGHKSPLKERGAKMLF